MSSIPIAVPAAPGPAIPKPPGWAIPILIGVVGGKLLYDWFTADSGDRRYDMGGWSLVGVCAFPRLGVLRRWSNVGCLINQAVNFPGIRPQDNYAAHAITYEAFPTVYRLSNSDIWQRVQPGVLLPWEVEGGEGLPPLVSIPIVIDPVAPYIPLLEEQPIFGSALPIPVPLNVPGVRPAVPPIPGLPSDIRWNGPGRTYGAGVRTVTVAPGVPGIVNPWPVPIAVAKSRPVPQVKERKVEYRAAWRSVYMHGLNTITEVNDFVNVLHSALPRSCQARPVSLAPRGFQAQTVFGNVVRDDRTVSDRHLGVRSLPGWKVHTFVAKSPDFERYHRPRRIKEKVNGQWVWRGKLKHERTHRAPTPQEKMAAIYRCYEAMDLAKAVDGLIRETASDAVFGSTARAVAKSLPGSYTGLAGPLYGMNQIPRI